MLEKDIALQLNNLHVSYEQNRILTSVLDNISFNLYRGEILSLVGESGSGKSTIAKAISGLLPPSAHIESGNMKIGNDFDFNLNNDSIKWNVIRGRKLGFIFQDPRLALNPVMKVKDNFKELLLFHHIAQAEDIVSIAIKMLNMLNFSNPVNVLNSYPFQLSGGMCQRVCIALALCLKPRILIADEPTSALDLVSQKEVLDLLKNVQRKFDLSVLLITHDMSVANASSDRMIVLDNGVIVEEGKTQAILSKPQAECTKQLLNSRSLIAKTSSAERLQDSEVLILNAIQLRKSFSSKKDVLDGVDLTLYKSEILGILGESGCGKSTLANCLVGLELLGEGEVEFHGENINRIKGKQKREMRRYIQLIFQDARASLNPRCNALQLVQEPLRYLNIGIKDERVKLAEYYLNEVGIIGDMQARRPPQLSTGQCQRVAIARALIVKPEVLICDEVVSALDMTVQAQIIELLRKLHEQFQFSIIMITHDIRILRYFCDRILVMKNGNSCEVIKGGEKLNESKHPYTKLLLKYERDFEINTFSSVKKVRRC